MSIVISITSSIVLPVLTLGITDHRLGLVCTFHTSKLVGVMVAHPGLGLSHLQPVHGGRGSRFYPPGCCNDRSQLKPEVICSLFGALWISLFGGQKLMLKLSDIAREIRWAVFIKSRIIHYLFICQYINCRIVSPGFSTSLNISAESRGRLK
ncbi:hypothetical protein ElyMa_001944200 [Elysia marginata]|uniref:Uncharacterized protein n=1 Tax=Elysia marginata TaxID=1093978 RepID=A0AAV4EYD4_9GAST|nr:hypothetical protein ElyMa_001944200 [Elysia marginata]